MKVEEQNFEKDQFRLTMMPSRFAQGMRTCKIYQFYRFIVINLKMIIVVSKSH
jgi:hypothetical protein